MLAFTSVSALGLRLLRQSSTFHYFNSTAILCFSRKRFSSSSFHLQKNLSEYLHGPVGVEAAIRAASDPSFKPQPTLLQREFSLDGRVAVVTGGQRGLGLEMAEALAEAGATVYCLDLPIEPDSSFRAAQSYVKRLGLSEGARLEYASLDVTDQKGTWEVVEKIAKEEGRLDICIADAGILHAEKCLDYPSEEFQKLMNVNVNGVLHTAQAAGRQMVKLGSPGSIVLVASLGGIVAAKDQNWIAYQTSKAAVIHMGRSLACELGPEEIRVNTISPGFFYTPLTAPSLDKYPELKKEWSSQNPLGRIGHPKELRGAIVWLASDASTYCTGSDIVISGGHHAW